MKALLGLLLLGAALWSGYWFVGASSVERGFDGWFAERRAEGWAADYGDLSVRGFPNRFDASFTGLVLADPATGLAWEAPFFQVLALSYRPNHVIAVWPREQLLATPEGKYRVENAEMRASVVLDPGADLALERTTLTAADLLVSPVSPAGGSGGAGASTLSLAAERVEADAATYRLGLSAEGLKPAPDWRAAVDPEGRLPETFQAVRADLTVRFDRPWDRQAVEVARPQPREIRLRLAEARWGELELRLAGAVTVAEDGRPAGRITVKAQNWREVLDLAITAGAIPEAMAGTVEGALGLVAGLSGDPDTLDVPLDFRDGRMLLGPVPLGPAPVLALR